MTATVRFGLTLDDQLTDHDKRVIDAVLASLEIHDHKGGTRLGDPTAEPTLELDTTTGSLRGGTTYYYRLAYRDRFGLETAASAESSITTPAQVDVPAAPAVETVAGGALGAGATYYALSAVTAAGETALSSPALITITDWNTVNVSGTDPFYDASITAYNVWRQGPSSAGFTKIGQITDPSTPFVDDGSVPDDLCACDPANLPPSVNLTSSTNQVTVTVPVADQGLLAEDGLARSWVVYRSTTSGVYDESSLVAQVTQTVNEDGTGGIVVSFVDDGTTAPLEGAPLDNSQTLMPSRELAAGGGSGAGALQLRQTDAASMWALSADLDGSLVTDPSLIPLAAGDVFLVDSGNVQWKLTVDSDGSLRTTAGTATSDDLVMPDGALIATIDSTFAWLLTVETDGSLTATEAGVSHLPEEPTRVVNFDFDFSVAVLTNFAVLALAPGERVISSSLSIPTAFNGTTPTLTLNDLGLSYALTTADAVMGVSTLVQPAQSDFALVGNNTTSPITLYVQVDDGAGGDPAPTAGEARLSFVVAKNQMRAV